MTTWRCYRDTKDHQTQQLHPLISLMLAGHRIKPPVSTRRTLIELEPWTFSPSSRITWKSFALSCFLLFKVQMNYGHSERGSAETETHRPSRPSGHTNLPLKVDTLIRRAPEDLRPPYQLKITKGACTLWCSSAI